MKLFVQTVAVMSIAISVLTGLPSHADWQYENAEFVFPTTEAEGLVNQGTGLSTGGINFLDHGGVEAFADAWAPPSSWSCDCSGSVSVYYQWYGNGPFASIPDIPNTVHNLKSSAGGGASSVLGTSGAGSGGAQVQITGNSTLSIASGAQTSFNGSFGPFIGNNDPETVFHVIDGSSGLFSYGLTFSLSAHANTTGSTSGSTTATGSSNTDDGFGP